MGGKSSKRCRATKSKPKESMADPAVLASETPFSVKEVETLYDLYKKLSTSVVKDGYIQKEELQLALFQNSNKRNLFLDRIFDLFDVNNDGNIEFGEFVRALGVFHPKRLKGSKFHLKAMVMALLSESDLMLSDDIVESIVDKTFEEVDTKGDGRIDEEEWTHYASGNSQLLKNMTLPYLMDITLSFPSFVLNNEAGGSRQQPKSS